MEEKAAQLAGSAGESTGVGGGEVQAVFVDDSAAELLDPGRACQGYQPVQSRARV